MTRPGVTRRRGRGARGGRPVDEAAVPTRRRRRQRLRARAPAGGADGRIPAGSAAADAPRTGSTGHAGRREAASAGAPPTGSTACAPGPRRPRANLHRRARFDRTEGLAGAAGSRAPQAPPARAAPAGTAGTVVGRHRLLGRHHPLGRPACSTGTARSSGTAARRHRASTDSAGSGLRPGPIPPPCIGAATGSPRRSRGGAGAPGVPLAVGGRALRGGLWFTEERGHLAVRPRRAAVARTERRSP